MCGKYPRYEGKDGSIGMPAICNQSMVFTCPHMTGVVVTDPKQMKVRVAGTFAYRSTDVPSLAIGPGCTQIPSADPAKVPCTAITSPAIGSSRVMIAGQPALLPMGTFMTNGVPEFSGAAIQFPGQIKVNAAL